MNRLKELRGNRMQYIVSRHIGIDVGLMSKFENSRCNPTIDQAKTICDYHKKDVFEIWDKKDLDYSKISKIKAEQAKVPKGLETCKMTIRVSHALASKIRAQINEIKGVHTQAEYLAYCVALIDRRLAKRKSARGLADPTGTSEITSTVIITHD